MADTVITNTPGVTRGTDDGANAIGWAIAFLAIVAVLVAGFVLYRNGAFRAPANDGTNINVTVPSGQTTQPNGSGQSETSGSTGGGTVNY